MIVPYMVGKLAPNLTHSTKGLVKYVPGRGYFRAVCSQNGDKFVTSPPPPPIVERVGDTTISSPGRSPETPLPGIGLHYRLHGRQACLEFIAFDQGVGQICPR